MNPLTTPLSQTTASSDTTPVDEDLAEQARPGHGVPSQDPDAAAQVLLNTEDAARESHSVLVAGGLLAGAATGAAIGVVAAGPVGVLVGASVGAVAGALGSAAAGATVDPENGTSAEKSDKG